MNERQERLAQGYINKKDAMALTGLSRSVIDKAFKEIHEIIKKRGKKPLCRDVRVKDLFDVLGFEKGIEY